MGALKDLTNYQRFRRPRVRVIKALNNLYVVVNISRQALERERQSLVTTAPLKIPFEIPVIDGRVIPVDRRRSKINQLLKKAVGRDLMSQALVSAVALTEDYVGRTLAEVLRMYPKKLGQGVKGGESGKKIDVARVLDASSLDGLIDELIGERVNQALYAAPVDYFEYLERILSFALLDPTKASFVEVKATRDLIDHADGMVNSTYLEKTGEAARGSLGQEVPLDDTYSIQAVTGLKTLVVEIYRGCLDKHGSTPTLT